MILQHLRERTADLHARVEQTLAISRFLRDRAAYQRLLLRLLPFYIKAEETLEAFDWSEIDLDFIARRKAGLLGVDLYALGVAKQTVVAAVGMTKDCPFPQLRSPAAALGCCYVLEGATLGGKIIARMLQQSLDISQSTGGSFYNAYGDRSAGMWRQFCAAADRYCGTDPERANNATRAAVATFEAFESWLSGLTGPVEQVGAGLDQGERG